ncbi:MAG: SEC-C metal-binding domain-containing protein, partial [Solirubrobacterales bacterium]
IEEAAGAAAAGAAAGAGAVPVAAGDGSGNGQPSDENPATVVKSDRDKVGRNDPCWCGSGKKYKKCHGA